MTNNNKKIKDLLNNSSDYFSNIYANLGIILDAIESKENEDINNFFGDELNLVKNIELLTNDIRALALININIKKHIIQ